MEAYRSVIMEVFRDQFTAAELLSYKEVLFKEATEEWYAQRDPDEVGREKCSRHGNISIYLGKWLCLEKG